MHLLRRNTGRGDRRSRVSYANIVATLALVVAVGGGSAWAATRHHHHYLVTSTGQIKPKVLKKLHGAKGAPGANGANGAAGARGARGATGATGATGAVGVSAGSNTNVTLSAIRMAVVSATASTTGTDVVIAQVAAQRTNPGAKDTVSCVLNDITSSPGTDVDLVTATFPDTGATSTSSVDLPLQGEIPVKAGDTVAASCTGGSLGYAVQTANIALIPVP